MKRFFSLCLASGLAAANAETVTVTPSKDTDVYSFSYSGSGAPTSTTYTLGVNSTPLAETTVHSQKSLIQFNLAGVTIPADQIGSAVLRLLVVQPDPAFGSLAPGNVYVHRQATDWGAITAATPKWNSFQSAEVLGFIPVLATSADKWVELDITSAVKAWVGGTAANYGIFLAPFADKETPALNVTFASMEVPNYGPQIVITRKVVPPVLTISQAPGAGVIILKWPVAGSEGWVLQRADSPAGPWVANAATTTIVAGNYQLQPAMLTREFFRLKK
jgi:hypothetical protein